MLRIGSLFSGIGGLELGLETAGLGWTVWQVEVDEFCRSVLTKHWPLADRSVSDVKLANAESLSKVDVICGGFPCQDVSSAGKRVGLSGSRSGLWFEFARVVGELKPSVVVVENVASGKRAWLPTVRGDLHVLGYRTRAISLSASDVGAPHLRKRIFVVADSYGHGKPVGPIDAEASSSQTSFADAGATRRQGARTKAHEGWPGLAEDAWREPVSGMVPLVYGLPGGMVGRQRRQRIRALGNSVVPQCAEVIGRVIMDQYATR